MVVGNPCNTNGEARCLLRLLVRLLVVARLKISGSPWRHLTERDSAALIAMQNAPSLPRKNFHALTRLDENRAKCQLALKAQKFYTSVTSTCIWGNHSTTQVAACGCRPCPHGPASRSSSLSDSFCAGARLCKCQDCWRACATGTVPLADARSDAIYVASRLSWQDHKISTSILQVIDDERWLKEEFTPTVATRGVQAQSDTGNALKTTGALTSESRRWRVMRPALQA